MLALALAVGACSSDDGASDDAALDRPEDIVTRWLAAVDSADLDNLTATTMPANVALLAGAENGFTVEQMAAIVDLGLPSATARSYWGSFRESMTAFLGGGLEGVTVEGAESFTVGTSSYSAVTVERDGDTTDILARLGPDGWKVDLVATAGPALAVQIRRLVASIVESADDATARAYAQEAETSLGAALARDPGNRSLELEFEAIEDLPIDLGG